MTEQPLFPQHPGAGETTLTRRQLRERERAAERGSGTPQSPLEVVAVPPQAEAPAVPQANSEWESIFHLVAEEPAQPTSRRAAARAERDTTAAQLAARPRRTKNTRPTPASRRTKVKSKRIWVSSRSFAESGPPRRRVKAAATKALSCVAMLFAGALFVGVTVPSNAFVTSAASSDVNATAFDDTTLADADRPTQTLAVSDEVPAGVARHDDLKVISFAEVLAIKYANVSYEYQATDGAIRWPFPVSVPITDGYGDREGGFHKGTDFAAGAGTPIYAIADGVVSYVQADYSGYGYHAIITHIVNGQQVKSLYAHMVSDSSPLVVGEEISVGDFVGLVGDTGISYGAHLHLEIHLDDVPVDPFVWLTANAV